MIILISESFKNKWFRQYIRLKLVYSVHAHKAVLTCDLMQKKWSKSTSQCATLHCVHKIKRTIMKQNVNMIKQQVKVSSSLERLWHQPYAICHVIQLRILKSYFTLCFVNTNVLSSVLFYVFNTFINSSYLFIYFVIRN